MSELRTRFFIIGAAILIAAFFAIPPESRPLGDRKFLSGYKIHLGLDLRGGQELIYQVPILPSKTEHERVMGETVAILRERVEKSGIVAEPEVRRRGENEIQIQLPGVTPEESERIEQLLQRMGKLEFRLGATATEQSAEWEKFEPLVNLPKSDPKYKRHVEALEKNGSDPDEDGQIRGYRWYPDRQKKENPTGWRLLVLWEMVDGKKDTLFVVDGQKIKTVGLDTMPEIRPRFELKEEFAHDFGVFTEAHKGQPLAIVYDDEVVSDPNIKERLDGSGVIEGMTPTEARQLKTVMASGKLDVKPTQIARNAIEPSLGSDSIRRGVWSTFVGLALVIVLILFYYRFPGLLANLALALNLLFLYATLVLTGATLTLPGIAGFVLTVGMSIDANILIYERIREERARGKTLEQAIRNGFDRAFVAIVDSNVTTLITAAILWFVGSGPVQGFAVALFWGITCSMFTALFVVKTLMMACVQSGILTEFKVMKVMAAPNFDFVGKRRAALLVSAIVLAAGTVLFVREGSSILGVEMKGGMQTQVRLDQEKVTDEIRDQVKADLRSTQVQALRDIERFFGGARPGAATKEQAAEEREARGGRSNRFVITAGHFPLIAEDGDDLRAKKPRLLARLRELRGGPKSWAADGEEGAIVRALEKLLVEEARRTGSEADVGSWPNYGEEEISLSYMETVLWKVFGGALVPPTVTPSAEQVAEERDAVAVDLHLMEDRPWMEVEQALRADGLRPGDEFEVVPLPGWGGAEVSEEQKAAIAAARDDAAKKDAFQARHFRIVLKREIDDRDAFQERANGDAIYSQLAPEGANWREYFVARGKFQKAGEIVQSALRKHKDADGELVFAKVLSNPFPSSANVSGSVSDRLKTDAFWATVGSLFAILLYITLRFQFWNGVAAIIALAHDVLFTLGAIAFFAAMGWVNVEINMAVIAALLTIVGYSINDTIVTYDRIRENIALGATPDFPKLINDSINQTLSRTIYTSLTVVLVVLAMFVITYGAGGVLEGFSFAMLAGLVSGTYSTIFIASPILIEKWLLDRRRMGDLEAARSLMPSAPPPPKEELGGGSPTASMPGAGASATAAPPSGAEDEGEEEEEEDESTEAATAAATQGGTSPTKPHHGPGKKKKKKKKKRKHGR